MAHTTHSLGFDPVYWDDSYPIALLLKRAHPNVDPSEISHDDLHRRVIALEAFADDADVFLVERLEDIQVEWLEVIA